MGILLGLTAALCWGAGEYLAGDSSRRIGAFRTLFYVQFSGLFLSTLYAFATGEFARLPSIPPSVWVAALVLAITNTASALCLYRAYAVGLIPIVSPISATYGAITTAMAFLSGETIGTLPLIGILVAIGGVIMTAMTSGGTKRAGLAMRGIGWAIAAAVGYGAIFWMLGFHVAPVMGGVLPVVLIRLTTLITLLVGARAMRQPLPLPQGQLRWVLPLIGTLDTVAFISSAIGVTTDQVSIVTVLGSLNTAVTVLLAWVILRERLRPLQWLGVSLIFVGIMLVSI